MDSFSAWCAGQQRRGDPAERKENMAIKTEVERLALTDQLAVAYAFLRFRAPRGGGFPRSNEVKAARRQIVSDPAYEKLCAPTESECTVLLRQYGFEPPVVRRVNQKT